MITPLLDDLLPGICLLCEQSRHTPPQRDLCRHCAAVLPWNDAPCERCGEPEQAPRCARCRVDPPPFHRALAPLLLRHWPAQWVERAKAGRDLVTPRLLGMLLADAVVDAYRTRPLPTAIVPVPLHWRRLMTRGHNQAQRIALPVARRLQLPLVERGLRRRPTPRLRRLDRRRRAACVAGAFILDRPLSGTVAIVDDVLTTGATAGALARTLLDAGAGEVHVWAATRTPAPDWDAETPAP